jgi:hypothetical protein
VQLVHQCFGVLISNFKHFSQGTKLVCTYLCILKLHAHAKHLTGVPDTQLFVQLFVQTSIVDLEHAELIELVHVAVPVDESQWDDDHQDEEYYAHYLNLVLLAN